MNEETKQIQCQIPGDVVITLGLLEYLREAVMTRMVRPALMPQVVAPPPDITLSRGQLT